MGNHHVQWENSLYMAIFNSYFDIISVQIEIFSESAQLHHPWRPADRTRGVARVRPAVSVELLSISSDGFK